MPNEIVSSVTEPPAPTARGIGEIVYQIVKKAIDEAGNTIAPPGLTPGLAIPTSVPGASGFASDSNQSNDLVDIQRFVIGTIIINAVIRYAPQKFPGADPEIIIVLDRINKAFKFTVTDITQAYFGGSIPDGTTPG